MASLAKACRISARLLNGRAVTRSFSTSSQHLAAQNFFMPALSPTMTEGNIASWKVEEGAAFSAGDVLLEIETDKATMDVEAQEDGIMMRIMSQDGAKAVQVGTRIAVVAEAGDDIGSLELPPDQSPLQSAAGASSSEPAAAAQQSGSPTSTAGSSASASSQGRGSAGAGTYNHNYPLMPSVIQLIHQNSISKEEVNRIKGTGPNGRLLKGDVLAYLGTINTAQPETISAHFQKLSHLDLSNIKVAARVTAPPAPKQDSAAPQKKAAEPEVVTVQVSLTLDAVMDLQRTIGKKIGVSLDIQELIARASRVANVNLGPSSRAPTADELFDQILGLHKLKFSPRDQYRPIISAVTPPLERSAPKPDIIDILAGPKKASRRMRNDRFIPGSIAMNNVLSLVVPREDQKRATRFLEHCKSILEEYPQQLVEL